MKTYIRQMGFLVLGLQVFLSSYSQEQPSVSMMKDALVMKTEGVCFLGTGLNEDDAKTFAINDAKRNALEQAGTYIESHTMVLNQQLVKDEVITFSAGLLKVKVLKEERTVINKMFAFKVNILAAIDTKLLAQRIAEIRSDNRLREQLEAEREKVKQLSAKIAELQTVGKTVTKQEVKNVINELSAIDWYNKGYDTKDLKRKIKFFSKAIELNPQYGAAYLNRGFTYSKLGNDDAAILDLNKFFELIPEFKEDYANHANRLLAFLWFMEGNDTKDVKQKIEFYSKAIELDPQFADFYVNRGAVYSDLGNFDTAIRDYNKAIELNSQYAAAYHNRGTAYANLGNHNSAIRDFSKAIELKPYMAEAYVNRGTTYDHLGNYNSAIQDFSKAIELNPHLAVIFIKRAAAFESLKNTNAAVDDYNRCLRISGDKSVDAEQIRQKIRDLGYTPEY